MPQSSRRRKAVLTKQSAVVIRRLSFSGHILLEEMSEIPVGERLLEFVLGYDLYHDGIWVLIKWA